MAKDVTLLGYIGSVCKNIEDSRKEDNNSPIATQADVERIIKEMITETYINSLSAKASEPTQETIDNKMFFFANGTPVTIEAKEDGSEGAVIKWANGELEVAANTQVFAGRHNDDTLTNTSVIMNGGTVWRVYGGGLHKSHTVNAVVEINGGHVSNVCGGGAAHLTTACGCTLPKTMDDCVCVTDNTSVKIAGGEGMTLVYGGGQGLSYTKRATTVVDGGVMNYFTSACVNGRTDVAVATINGGVINILQGLNRGTVDTIKTVINGGTITKAFVGGEVPFIGTPDKPNGSDPHGTFKSASLEINGGEIGSVEAGGNNYQVIEMDDPAISFVDNR